jgi:hypothetical protein
MTRIASSRQIGRNCKVADRLVAAGSTLTLTQAEHEGRVICLDTTTGSVVTLPASTGGGAVYKFLQTVLATTSSHKIQVANATDVMAGIVFTVTTTSDNAECFATSATSDTITLNRTTSGGTQIGEWFEITDAVSRTFTVRGMTRATGSEITPFSAAV